MPKNAEKYYCELCDYVTRDKQDYNRHLSTRKHKMVVNGSNIPKKSQKIFLQMWKFLFFI